MGSRFERETFETDLRRIKAFYADRGYPDATVIDSKVDLNAARDAVELTIVISEGRPLRVGSLDLVGFDVLPNDARDELRDRMPLKIGEPLDRLALAESGEIAANTLENHGYPFAEVRGDRMFLANDTMAVTFEVHPGTTGYFGRSTSLSTFHAVVSASG